MGDQNSRLSTAMREGSMITVILQPQDTTYKVHRALLVKHSEYFNKALTGPWTEADERTIKLNDVDDRTFDVFVEWLYTQSIDTRIAIYQPNLTSVDSVQHDKVKDYVFGDRFLALDFKATVLRHIVWAYDVDPCADPPVDAIISAFEHLPEHDVLLELLVDVYGRRCGCVDNGKEDERHFEKLPREFLVRVAKRLRNTKKSRGWEFDGDKYQLHTEADQDDFNNLYT